MKLSVLVDGDKPASIHLQGVLRRCAATETELELWVADRRGLESARSVVAESACRADVRVSSGPSDWERYHIVLAGRAMAPTTILEALASGVCVIPSDAPGWSDADWCDLEQGWRDNRDAGFYAKVFTPSVHIGCPSRLD